MDLKKSKRTCNSQGCLKAKWLDSDCCKMHHAERAGELANYQQSQHYLTCYITNLLNLLSYPFMLNIVVDKGLGNGLLIRPDLRFTVKNYSCLIEIDENQHKSKSYQLLHEERNLQLQESFSHKTLILVRINPDSYIDSQGVKHPPILTRIQRTSKDTMHVQRENILNEAEWEERRLILKEVIRDIYENNLNKYSENELNYLEIKLFYDSAFYRFASKKIQTPTPTTNN